MTIILVHTRQYVKIIPGENFWEHGATNTFLLKFNNRSVSFDNFIKKKNENWFKNVNNPLSESGTWSLRQFMQSSYETRPGVPDV